MNSVEKLIIRELQTELPIVSRPFGIVAHKIGIDEQLVLEKTRDMLSQGVLRKIGAVLRHRRIGFQANALCMWMVPPEEVGIVGEAFAQMSAVTHCYERSSYPDWPYNVYTMVHAMTRADCENIIRVMAEKCSIYNYKIFYSTHEFKKTSMKYFE